MMTTEQPTHDIKPENLPWDTAEEIVLPILEEMGIEDAEYRQKALELAEVGRTETDHAPSSSAAGAVYAAGLLVNQKHTQQEVANAADVIRLTVQNTYQDILVAAGVVDESNFDSEQKDEPQPKSVLSRIKRRVLHADE